MIEITPDQAWIKDALFILAGIVLIMWIGYFIYCKAQRGRRERLRSEIESNIASGQVGPAIRKVKRLQRMNKWK